MYILFNDWCNDMMILSNDWWWSEDIYDMIYLFIYLLAVIGINGKNNL